MTMSSHPEKRCSRMLLVCMVITTLISSSLALASTPPTYDRLDPISAQVQSPAGLAIDQQGRVYVAETAGNMVTIFSQGGRLLHAITGQQSPVSVAVGANGRIYIGNMKTGNVSVYSSSYSFLHKLGNGDGEFGLPNSITVDNSTHIIYVADRTASVIKTYNPGGSYRSTLGQPGNGDGQFHQPISIAIDQAAGELIILDLQQKPDSIYGTMINGARIQYFDLNGSFLRGYSRSGYKLDAGELARPIHLSVDSTSRIYVTDSLWQAVLVYDNTNTFIGQINDGNNPLEIPLGLTMGSSNRLYVSSYMAGKVEVYGVDNYSAMEVTPPTLSFQAVEGGASPDSQSTTINNNGKAALSWTATSNDAWVNMTDPSGTLLAPGSRTLEVAMDTQGMASGIYTGTIDIEIESGVTETVSVALTVLENPLQISPASLTFNAGIGTTPAGQPLTVSTNSLTPVNWAASADAAWLSISKSEGSTTEDVRVYAATEGLAAGTHTGSITFYNQDDVDNPAPVAITVTLNLTDPGVTPIEPPETPVTGQDGDNRKWTVTQVLPGTSLNGVWGSSSKNIYVVGAEGTILKSDGNKWNAMDSGSGNALYSVWGSAEDNVYAVGDSGLVLHYDGTAWTTVAPITEETLQDVTGTETDVLAVDTFGSILRDSLASSTESGVALRSIWGSSDSDIFVVGEAGAVLHYDGTDWTSMDSDTTQWLNAVWGSSAEDVFGVGENGAIIHYDGTIWSSMDSGTGETLLSVWGGSGTDVFAVGTNGLVLHYNGSGWSPVSSGATVSLNDVWVSAKAAVYAVGEDGIIISGKSKFPWLHFITNTILPNAVKDEDEDKKIEKGLMPTTLDEGKE